MAGDAALASAEAFLRGANRHGLANRLEAAAASTKAILATARALGWQPPPVEPVAETHSVDTWGRANRVGPPFSVLVEPVSVTERERALVREALALNDLPRFDGARESEMEFVLRVVRSVNAKERR